MVRGASGRIGRRDGEPLRTLRGAQRVARSPQIENWKPHIGRKVSIRYALHDEEHPFSEAIGVVMSVDADPEGGQIVEILTKRGVVTSVSTRDLIASKLFPL